MSDAELLMKYFDNMPKCWRDDGYIAAKEVAKRLCSHSESDSGSDGDNNALDDVVPWVTYDTRLAKTPVRFRWMIEADARMARREVNTGDYDISTFRKLLKHGRHRLLQTRNLGERTIKTLDDEFTARNCPEWLSS